MNNKDSYIPLTMIRDIKPAPKKDSDESAEESSLYDKAMRAIKTVYDPEIPVDIYELGLIYEVKVHDNNDVSVLMTLTSPGCFAAAQIPKEIEDKILLIPEVEHVYVELTFDPPWDKSMMSEAAQLELGFW